MNALNTFFFFLIKEQMLKLCDKCKKNLFYIKKVKMDVKALYNFDKIKEQILINVVLKEFTGHDKE